MSVRNGFVLLLALSALTFLVACGGSSSGISNPTPPPTGGFTNANLNGTYVFSVSGTDSNDASYAIAGTLTADGSGGNGKGNITAGAIDINDPSGLTAPAAGVPINSGGFYSISVDGRGQITIGISQAISGFPNLTFDFVLQDTNHGLVTEFDPFGTGSGTIDLQAAGVTPTGSYAFSLSGASGTSAWATAGNFTLTGSALAGLDDLNEGGASILPGQALSGSLALASSNGPATTLTVPGFSGTFDAFAIDSTHLKLIEMDTIATLSGDAFSQTSTDFPTGTLAFTLEGEILSGFFAGGGIMTTTGTSISGTEDYNQNGSPSSASAPPPFTATSTAGGTGRFTLGGFSSSFVGGTSYAAYPSSGGLLLLEIDGTGITTGAAYSQSASATLAASEGYGLNLSGIFAPGTANAAEVDDIAEFTTSSNGNTISGVIDENSTASLQGAVSTTFSAPFVNNSTATSTYTTPTGGRGQIGASVGTSSNDTTLNGGFLLTYYTVDGTTFPFIETDSGQVSAGVFVQQNPSASASAARHAMFVVQPIIRPHATAKKQKQIKLTN
ncbi:MAG TPA: hypothetical protein VNY51_08640 [Candidatus Dormibacteraeota bacterium]|nr:hypothetical protein [Candidatus Dormibacteraeota bacterium]